MYKAVINGRIVTEGVIIAADIVISPAGTIAEILPQGAAESTYPLSEITDAKGCYVVPGGIDAHVHFGGLASGQAVEDFYSGSKAALAGGTTTVVDFCESLPGEDPLDCIAKRKQDAACAMVDYTFHYTFTKNYKSQLLVLGRIAEQGIAAFKAYTYYDNTALTTGDFREIMKAICLRGPLLIHAEEKTIIDAEIKKVPDSEKYNLLYLALTRPNVTEQIAVETVLALAKESGAKVCIAHTSTGLTAEIRKRERLAGNDRFILETCPHYLHLTQDKLEGPDGALYTMNPPLRRPADNKRLWSALLEGDIAFLSTDHCPYFRRDKFGKDYLTIPCGVDGVQTRMAFLFSEGVVKRGLPMTEYVKLTSTNAAIFYHLYPQKGVISKNSDADLTIIDPDTQWIWNSASIAGAADYSILDGLKVTGAISCVIKGGNIVMKDGKVIAEKGSGRFLPTV